MTADDTKTVITPEQVAVTFRLAGIGTRFAAVLVDTCLQGLVILVIVLGFASLEDLVSAVLEQASTWLMAVFFLLLFLALWGYFIFWETVWSGRTPGKRLAGIRVMMDTGHPIDFWAAFLRNICRYVDFLPAAYGVGTLAMFLSKDSKRLGDYVAGTVVVVDAPRRPKAQEVPPQERREYRLLGDPTVLNLRAIDREQLAVVGRYLQRREELPSGPRAELAREIAEPLMAVLGLAHTPEYPYEEFLAEVSMACRALHE